MGGGKKRALNGRINTAGSRVLPVRDAQAYSKPGKTKPGSKSLLTGSSKGKKKISIKLKSSKTTNNKKENNKINRKKKPKC